jgi:hypothetical protein
MLELCTWLRRVPAQAFTPAKTPSFKPGKPVAATKQHIETMASTIMGSSPTFSRLGVVLKPSIGCGIVVHDAQHLGPILYRSQEPPFVPETPGELRGTVGTVVFPTGLDRRGERVFDASYGMADAEIGRGRLTLG